MQETPIICGGYTVGNVCYSYENNSWILSNSLTENRTYAAAASSPFPKEPHSLFVTGGRIKDWPNQTNSIDFWHEGKWEAVTPALPPVISHHCMVKKDSFSTMAVGGKQNYATSANSYLFDSRRDTWDNGRSLNSRRDCVSCARIRTDDKGSKFSIIVVGGYDGTRMKSTEILDEDSDVWRMGPQLPIGICCAALVEDPAGGVVAI
jgi:hypothetical protein